MLMNASPADRLAFVLSIQGAKPLTFGYYRTWHGKPALQAQLRATLPQIYVAYQLHQKDNNEPHS